MRNRLLIFIILFFIAGCKSKSGVPSGVVAPKKMQAILWDMMRADQFLADYVLNKDTSLNKTTESLKYYQQIFALHKISKEQFQHSFSFYKTHPVLLKTIMDSIAAPPKDTIAKVIQTVPISDTVIAKPDTLAKPDTTVKRSGKLLPDSTKIRKKIKQLVVD